MSYYLNLNNIVYERIWEHLLPNKSSMEQAVFLFCEYELIDDKLNFFVKEEKLLAGIDFDIQSEYYIELKDYVIGDVIKHAHNSGYSIVELHSHPTQLIAKFSYSDIISLKKTVHHMNWRLKNRPYMAIVVTQTNYDGFVWSNGVMKPNVISGIMVGDKCIPPTNCSEMEWENV